MHMAFFDQNGNQLSPCICSKVRFALELNETMPRNSKVCSINYWDRVVREMARQNNIEDDDRINNAINRYTEFN